VVRRRTDPQGRYFSAERIAAAESGELEITVAGFFPLAIFLKKQSDVGVTNSDAGTFCG
jgi:hypothetical protein